MKTQILEASGSSAVSTGLVGLSVATVLFLVFIFATKPKSPGAKRWDILIGAPAALVVLLSVAALNSSAGIGDLQEYTGSVTVAYVQGQGGGRLIEVEESSETFYIGAKTKKIIRVGDVLELECKGSLHRVCGIAPGEG